MTYFLAPSLVRFRNEINEEWPDRSTASDGWIGDPSHAARVSSHNPLWSAPGKWSGVVRAIDVTNDSDSMRKKVVNAAVGHPAVWYVISKGIIYSRTFGWSPNRYTGSNPHDHHVHVSVRELIEAWDNNTDWLENTYKIKPKPVHIEPVRNQFFIAIGEHPGKINQNNGVAKIQRALNKRLDLDLTVDGYVGDGTLKAWAQWERKRGGLGRVRVPDKRSLSQLAQGEFRLVGV